MNQQRMRSEPSYVFKGSYFLTNFKKEFIIGPDTQSEHRVKGSQKELICVHISETSNSPDANK